MSAYIVSVYETNRVLGSPKKGGWYYDCGTPSLEHLGKLRIYEDEEEALEYLGRLREELVQTNREAGRRDLDSVLCNGWLTAQIDKDELPHAWPREVPHYE